jgi:Protein of unknown function with HXXEE motif
MNECENSAKISITMDMSILHISPRHRWLIGGIFVLAAIIANVAWMGRAIWGLNVGLIVAYAIWTAREARAEAVSTSVLPTYLLAVALQCLHFTEEYLAGFQRDFPQRLGYQWSDQQFVAFNLLWLCIFILAAAGVYKKMALAFLIVWFFAIVGGLANGILHLMMAIAQGRYFPGAFTAPFLLLAGIILIRNLRKEKLI